MTQSKRIPPIWPQRRKSARPIVAAGCACTARCWPFGCSKSTSTILYTRARDARSWRIYISAKKRLRSACARRCGRTTTSPARIAGMGTAWPRALRSSACLPSCWARKPVIAGVKAARCTSPTRIPATWAPMPSWGQRGHCHRRGVLRQDAGNRPGRRVLFRRRRHGAGTALRSHEHGRALEAARHLCLREQPLRRIHPLS